VTLDELLIEALRLKELPRAGWLRVGVKDPESVASHSWGVAWLALVLCPSNLDPQRVLELAIIHDLPEVITGDITPHDEITTEEKASAENLAAAKLFSTNGRLGALWNEYCEHQTPEAQFVHELDKLDMALQAIRYNQRDDINTVEFIDSAKKQLLQSNLDLLRRLLTH